MSCYRMGTSLGKNEVLVGFLVSIGWDYGMS